MLPQVEQALIERDNNRVIRKVQPMADVAARSYEDDRAMAVVLGSVVVAAHRRSRRSASSGSRASA